MVWGGVRTEYIFCQKDEKSIEKHLTHIKLNIVCVPALPCLTVMNVVCACLSFPLYFILLFLFSRAHKALFRVYIL